MSRKKYFWCLIAAEALILIIFLLPFFQKCEVYEYDFRQMESWSEYGIETETGWLIQAENIGEEGYEGIFTYNPFFDLKRGSYAVSVDYKTDSEGNVAYLSNNSRNSFDAVLCDKVLLSPNKNRITFQAYLKERVALAHIMTEYKSGDLLVSSVTIQRTRDMDRSALVTALFFITLFNIVLHLAATGFFKRLTSEQINVAVILSAALVYVCYTLYIDKLVYGADLIFHLLRIESIKDSILAGDFYAKIQPAFLEGYGYASSVFYPDTLLYFPALLRVIGFTIQRSYKIFIVAINIALCLSTYFCVKKFVKNRYIAALGAVLMLYSPFHIFGTFLDHQIGAATALIFIPMVILGLYRIYTEDVKSRNYKYTFILPAIGFWGLLNTHVLSTEMAGMFTLIACVCFLKKTLRKETFLVLCATALTAVVLSSGFLVPFLDYYLHGEFRINADTEVLWIQECGLQLAQLFLVFPSAVRNETILTGDNLVIMENPGIAVYILLVVFGYAYFTADREERKKARGMWALTGFGMLALFMTTCYFPWDLLRKVLDEFHMAFLVDCIQFPVRYMQFAVCFLIFPCCYGIKMLLQRGEKRTVRNVLVLAVGLMITSSTYMLNHTLAVREERSYYDLQQHVGRHTWSLEEYLPKDTDLSYLTAIGVVPYDGVQIYEFDKRFLDIRMEIKNEGKESYVDVPLLYYDGYRAECEDKTVLATYESDNNNVVRFDVPEGFHGKVHVYFRQPLLWRLAECLSVFSLAAFAVYIFKRFYGGYL